PASICSDARSTSGRCPNAIEMPSSVTRGTPHANTKVCLRAAWHRFCCNAAVVNSATLHAPRSRHPKLVWTLFSALVCLIALAVLTTVFVPISSDSVRQRLVAFLADKLDSDVELGSISLRTFPGIHIDASNLVIRQKGRSDLPPRFEIRNFSVDAN